MPSPARVPRPGAMAEGCPGGLGAAGGADRGEEPPPLGGGQPAPRRGFTAAAAQAARGAPCPLPAVRAAQAVLPSLRPRRYPPGDNVSAAGAAALPARLRAESKHRGRRQPPFFFYPGSLSTGSPPTPPDPPRLARLPSPAAPESRCCPASAEAATPS